MKSTPSFLIVLVLFLTVTVIQAQESRYNEVIEIGFPVAFNSQGTYDNDNALWTLTPRGLNKYINNKTLFYPFENYESKEVIFKKSLQLFVSSTNEIFTTHEDYGIYKFNIITEKGHWLNVLDGNVAMIIEDNKKKLWFSVNNGNVYKYDLINGAVEKLEITQIKNKKFLNPKNRIDFFNENLNSYIVNDSLFFQKGLKSEIYYFKNTESYQVDFSDSFLENLKGNKAVIITNLGALYPTSSSTSYTYSYLDTKYNIEYNKQFNCHFVQVPNSEDKNERFHNTYIQNNRSNKVSKLKLIYSKDKRVNVLELKTDIVSNELQVVTSLDFNNIVLKVAVNNNQIAVFSGNLIEIASIQIPFFDKLLEKSKELRIVRPMIEAEDGTIFIQTNHGLYTLKDNSLSKLDLSTDINFKYVYDLSIEGDVLWGIYNDLLFKLDLQNYCTDSFALANNTVLSNLKKSIVFKYIESIDKSNLFLAGHLGLYTFNWRTNTLKKCASINDGTPIRKINHLIKVDENEYWIATDKDVYKIDQDLNVLTKLQLNKGDIPKLFFRTAPDELMIALNDNSLLHFNLNNNHTYNDSYFKNNNFEIAGLIRKEDDVWVSTYKGLVHFNINKPSAKKIFTTVDGLSNNEFNTNSYLKTKSGILFFGGMEGLVRLERTPKFMNKVNDLVTIKLEKVEIISKLNKKDYSKSKIDSTHHINLDKFNNSLNILISSNLNYLDSKRLTYYYRSLNLSEDWFELTSEGLVRLYGLPTGKNDIEIKAVSQQSTSNVLRYSILVSDVFYKQSWFISAIILLFILFLSTTVFFKIRQKQVFIKNKNKLETLELRALISRMNPHFLHNTVNNLQGMLLSQDRNVIIKYFDGFSQLLRHTSKMSRLKNNSLKDEIAYLESYVLLSEMRLNNELVCELTVDEEIDLDKVKVPSLIIQPIIENAIIHGLKPKPGTKHLFVNFTKEQDKILKVEIIDHGIGRVEAERLKQNSILNINSLDSNILKARLDIFNRKEDKITITYQDLTPQNDTTFGTKVTIRFLDVL